MLTHPFESSRIKIERAKTHFVELNREIDNYFSRGAVRVVCERAKGFEKLSCDMHAFTYRESEPVPVMWSAIVGDVIHNLRTSLDLLASDLHRITGGKAKDADNVHYPFCKTADYLPDMIRSRRLNGIGREFLDIICKTAPYRGGNDGLRAIHDLDGMNKHRALIPVVAIVSVDWPVPIATGQQKFSTTVAKDGQHLMLFPKAYFSAPTGTEVKADFAILFNADGPFRGARIVPQLQACIGSIEAIVALFQAAVDKNPTLQRERLSTSVRS